jgi:glycine/D-amino acid oxidase-like deaminating enzyme
VNRRTLLKALVAGSGSWLLEGCAAKRVRPPLNASAASRAHLPKVLVSADREIRTTVCLRPFRPPGFRLAAEKIDDKLCVHNYGHGGAGITLSWGTAQLASEKVANSSHKQVAVLGCGVIGLSTARLLQQTGKEVTIYAKALPPETTSNSAGGLWLPYSLFDPGRETPQFHEQLLQSLKFAYTYFQQFAGEEYGVHWLPSYGMSNEPFSVRDTRPFPEVFPESRDLQPSEHNFPYRYVRQFKTMLIEPHPYLRALLRSFQLAGGRVALQEFHNISEIATLPQPVVVNCTGLGARDLFSDAELIPIKGQLTFLLPQPEINYIVLAGDLYMFPRQDGIVLGGTHVRGDWSLEPDLAAKKRILTGHADLFSGL